MEIWKDIKGYEGLYQVSNLGNVRSLNFHREKKIKILKPNLKKDGYYETTLSKNSKFKWVRTHRLVAEAFIPNIYNKPQVNHINGNKLDNKAENLEWCTNQENITHAIITGLEKLNGHENPNAKEVNQYDLNNNFIKSYKCLKYAQEETGIKYRYISEACHLKRKSAGGYIWKFENIVKEV